MDLYHEYPTDTFTLWTGQPVESGDPDLGAVSYDPQIATLWSPEQLAEKGFYRPEHDPVPDGKVIASSAVQRVDGAVKFVDAYEDVVISTDEVNAERERRTFPGAIRVTSAALPAPIPVDMRSNTDRDNLGNLVTGAVVAKGKGITAPITEFGDADNNVTPLTADQVIVLGMACLAYGSAVWVAARTLKNSSPIPLDFADDKYWPSREVTG